MAKRLDSFPFHKSRAGKYPWDQWLNGETWQLTKGTDFETDLEIMRRATRTEAIKRGLNVHTSVDKNRGQVIFQAYDPKSTKTKTKSKKPRT